MFVHSLFSCLFVLPLVGSSHAASSNITRKECVVQPGGSNGTDDGVAIRQAFRDCGHGGKVVFLNETYYVSSIMNTSGLEDCDIELHGTLLVSRTFIHNTQPPFTTHPKSS